MRLTVIGSPDSWHVGRIVAEAEARGHVVAVVGWREIGAEIGVEIDPHRPPPGAVERFTPEPIERAEVVIVRGMPGGRLEEVIVRMDLLGRLAARGTPVINSPRGLEAAIDKYLSLARLGAAGVHVPRTIVAQSPESIHAAWRSLGGDVVVKPLFGSGGRGIERIATEADLAPLLAAAEAQPDGIATYLQEFIPHGGWDVRILVVGNTCFSIRRRSATDWRTNLARGAHADAAPPPDGWTDAARRAAALLDVEVAGVDVLPDPQGRPVILEVNAVPGWRGLAAATGLDPTRALIDWAETRAAGARGTPAPP